MRQFRASAAGPSEPQPPAEPDEPPLAEASVTRSQLSRAIVRRAWQAAVIGLCVFPPLNFYSLWLLWKLVPRDTPLGNADRRRCEAAFLINIVTILLCVLLYGLVPFYYLQNGPTFGMPVVTTLQHAMGR